MTFHFKNLALSTTLSVLLGSLFITTPALAAVVIDPTTEPASVAAPYVLSNTDLASGTETAYRPWFENGAWQGDLVQYNISASGSSSTSIDLSTSPPTDDGTATNWSARLQFDAAATVNPSFWYTGTGARQIITSKTGTDQVDFFWGNLTAAQQTAIDSVAQSATAASSDILDFVRGDRSNETPAGSFRKRYNILGDIVHSTAVYVGAPAASFSLNGYDNYKNKNKLDSPISGQADRTPIVYVGANDGMLHAFNASTGNEVFSYVPSMVFGNLGKLTADPYVHTYFVDGELSVGDIDFDTTNIDWRTILVAGLGSGGKGLFALDVTHDTLLGNQKVLWEKTGNAYGYIHGKAQIALLNDSTGSGSTWYVIQGNGYGSVDDVAKLLLIESDGTVTEIATDVSITGNGLSSPALVDTNSDGKPDYAYAGDLKGNLWKFNLKTKTAGLKLFVTGANQPITITPDIARHPNGGIMVYFGTGNLLSGPNTASADTSDTAAQTFYGIWDNNATALINNDGSILNQPLTQTDYAAGTTIRYSTNNTAINWATNTGWKVPFPTNGERLVGDPQLRAGRLQFITTSFDADMQPVAWLMELNYLNGGDNDKVLFDLDADTIRDGVDTVNRPTDPDTGLPTGTGDIPIAIKYGASGIYSQPTIARISNTADTLLVNGLLMPVPSSCTGYCSTGFIGGHIDVDTDSLYAGTQAQKEPGLGGVTNGHWHEYDKDHGVVFTDYFNLEPRRDKETMNIGKTGILGSKLNRITEACDPDLINSTCATNTPANKLFGDNTSTTSGDKKFFILIANADLNSGATITIGTKTWKVKDYQDMITPLILAKANANVSADATFVDVDGDSLIFTLNSIKAAGGNTGTLRVDYDSRAILDGGIHGTINGCVKGQDNPYNKNDTSNPLLGSNNAHITNAQETGITGYRWRNGALTLHFIDAANYKLQPIGDIPHDASNKSVAGTHAKLYTQTAFADNGDNVTILSVNNTTDKSNGLLYESTVFNHYGKLYELIRTGGPVKAECYGTPNYKAIITIERKGLTLGEYNNLTSVFKNNQNLQDAFGAALAAFESATSEADKLSTKAALQKIIKDNSLENYMKYRSYIKDLIPPQKLLGWDKTFTDGATTTTTPADVQDATKDDDQLGQNFRTGRRTWIDLTP